MDATPVKVSAQTPVQTFLECVRRAIDQVIDPHSTVVTCFNNYYKRVSRKESVCIDHCVAVCITYQAQILTKSQSWLVDNIVTLGTGNICLKLSLIYTKTAAKDLTLAYELIYQLLRVASSAPEGACGAKGDNISELKDIKYFYEAAVTNGPQDCSDECSQSGSSDDTPEEVYELRNAITGIFKSLAPEMTSTLHSLELPPPEGVIIGEKGQAMINQKTDAIRKIYNTITDQLDLSSN